MFLFSKNSAYPIGLDMGEDGLRLAQLKRRQDGRIDLIAGANKSKPKNVETAGGKWQRWAIDVVRNLTAEENFQGDDIVAAMPPGEVFIDIIKTPKSAGKKLEELIYSKIKKKLTFDYDAMMLKYIACEEDNLLTIATERQKVERYLAVFEQTNLQIKSIEVWPVALANCYVNFFGRRRADLEAVVMLLDFTFGFVNVVICRSKNVLFARSIPIDSEKLDADRIRKLVLELSSCRRQFGSLYRKACIERLIFLTPAPIDKQNCMIIAEKLQMPAQIGNCLEVVKTACPAESETEKKAGGSRRRPVQKKTSQNSWAVAFGLSLGID